MASVAWHFSNQYRAGAKVRLFEGTDGYADGEQRRDFVHVDDVAKVNLWAAGEAARTGIYNVGTGRSRTFNDMAASVINAWCAGKGAAPMTTAELVATKSIEYAPFPDNLRGKYQSFTQADVTHLRDGGYTEPFVDLDIGVSRYVDKLKAAYERE
jgi:ADP-L-glycero-D-manno-heptose 6-epimerase